MKETNLGSGAPLEDKTSRRWLIWPALIVVAFLAGLLPMWALMKGIEYDLRDARVGLQRNLLLNDLSAAAVYARRGEYETARQNASKFYTDIQTELGNAESTTLTAAERAQMPQLLTSRDEILSLLSRADPASAERLSNLYVEYRLATASAQP